jgi:hypothetical protein
MPDNKSIIITTINYPTDGVKKIAENYKDWSFIVVGEKKHRQTGTGKAFNFCLFQTN